MAQSVELLIHNIRSVYNVGSIFRTAEALGVRKVWLSGYAPRPIDRFGRKRNDFAKVSLGAETVIGWAEVDEVLDFITHQKMAGYEIVALEQSPTSKSLHLYKPEKPVLLIPGTETTGIDESILALADVIVEIEQKGTKESLNVASATAIALYHLLVTQ